MEFLIKHLNLRCFVFIFLLLNLNSITHAQNTRKNNFFADIKTIDLAVDMNGDFNFCKVRESDVKSAVGYTLANSPLKRIDNNSLDTMYIGIIVLNNQSDRGANFGCSVALNFELWRYTNFRGNFNNVTVWTQNFLLTGTENSIGTQVNTRVERSIKDFVTKWAEQN